jgi:hypothetical protein
VQPAQNTVQQHGLVVPHNATSGRNPRVRTAFSAICTLVKPHLRPRLRHFCTKLPGMYTAAITFLAVCENTSHERHTLYLSVRKASVSSTRSTHGCSGLTFSFADVETSETAKPMRSARPDQHVTQGTGKHSKKNSLGSVNDAELKLAYAPDAMNVVLGFIWERHVDNVRQLTDVKPACCNVSADE